MIGEDFTLKALRFFNRKSILKRQVKVIQIQSGGGDEDFETDSDSSDSCILNEDNNIPIESFDCQSEEFTANPEGTDNSQTQEQPQPGTSRPKQTKALEKKDFIEPPSKKFKFNILG